ncbi:MAG: hypothetical protein A2942_04860 [Candidatus Lloydbacteria bacterium RIFCSPLOWO2_01_FULL_50_20]|uniref:Uncharacterized protein n=1 Tax=Candidatus Lloydbacteria bacterium RIFCSPLOWO2_01_FULL_50_20 TaxID=1798665 RepID=A0A1G2DFQ9_9BACT|nr:MAG: hypothetical protein A3C13_02340 [Candidatus Lloydbacteria bacterium RIFCSPHIGHO2_02_FULL_50_11]OGZ11700.1 MAG: hypothetical protein A2942_04860 [Candidatus Lloydbacteria bacterium RIFCSPLOWO2_01_FULL_50_20]
MKNSIALVIAVAAFIFGMNQSIASRPMAMPEQSTQKLTLPRAGDMLIVHDTDIVDRKYPVSLVVVNLATGKQSYCTVDKGTSLRMLGSKGELFLVSVETKKTTGTCTYKQTGFLYQRDVERLQKKHANMLARQAIEKERNELFLQTYRAIMGKEKK